MTFHCRLAGTLPRAVSRRARLRRCRSRGQLPVAALRRAGDAVRAAARHGDELPVHRGTVHAGHRVHRAPLPRVGVALLGLRITLMRSAGSAGRRCCSRCRRRRDHHGVDPRRAGDWASGHLRTADRRRDCDLRRVGGVGAGGGAAVASAEGARPLFTIVGVAMLSTLAMIVYPMLANAIGLDARLAGVFLGASIHDIPQAVGAGYACRRKPATSPPSSSWRASRC